MESSYRIIKNQNLSQENLEEAIIETRVDLRQEVASQDIEDSRELADNFKEEEKISSEDMYRDKLLKLEEEKLQILFRAKKQAEAMVLEAGKKGQEEGYRAGYEKGLTQGQEEAETIKARAIKLIEDAQAYVDQYYKEKRQDIIQLAGQMAEAIVQQTIDMSNEGILTLINPILDRYAEEGTIVISCHPDKMASLKFKIAELEASYSQVRFVLLEDGNLEDYGCTIESDQQFIDLQLGKQLDSILSQINNME